jgi:histamine N-methyltransferase
VDESVSSELCPALTDQQFADSFGLFRQKTDQRVHMLAWIGDLFENLARRNKDMLSALSVGAGNGNFDLLLIELLSKKVQSLNYVAVEPNRILCDQFKREFRAIDSHNTSLCIVQSSFENYLVAKKYDLIHFTHCLYHIKDRHRALEIARSNLNDDGCILIFNSTAVGLQDVRIKFSSLVRGVQGDICTEEQIHSVLQSSNADYLYYELPSRVDVTECFDSHSEAGIMLLNFMLECDTQHLKKGLRATILNYLRSVSVERGGRIFMSHPVGTFLVSGK